MDAFANASFQGARLTDLSVLLTAESPEDYLDQASSLSQVADGPADHPHRRAGRPHDRRRCPGRRAGQPERGRSGAADRRTRPPPTQQAARAALDTGKAQLDAEIAGYQLAYAQLSTADINAAVAGAEAANLDAAAQTRQAEQAAQRDRAGLADDVAPADDRPRVLRVGGAACAERAGRHRGRGRPEPAGSALRVGRRGTGQLRLLQPDDVGVARRRGSTIPRNSAAQADALPQVPLDQLQPGDLVTFYSPVSHVGMYVGDGKVLHASMPGVPIKVVPLAAAGPNPTGHKVNR